MVMMVRKAWRASSLAVLPVACPKDSSACSTTLFSTQSDMVFVLQASSLSIQTDTIVVNLPIVKVDSLNSSNKLFQSC